MNKYWIALALTALFTGNVLAGNTGNDLLPGCRAFVADDESASAFLQGACAGEVIGVFNALELVGNVCRPEGTTQGQMVRVAVKFLDEYPAQHHKPFSLLLAVAATAIYPCEDS